MHVGSGGGGGSGGNGGNGGGSASGALVGDKKDEKKKLAPVSITLVSFAVSRKAYTKVRGFTHTLATWKLLLHSCTAKLLYHALQPCDTPDSKDEVIKVTSLSRFLQGKAALFPD